MNDNKKKKKKEKKELLKKKSEDAPILKEVIEYEDEGELIKDVSDKELN